MAKAKPERTDTGQGVSRGAGTESGPDPGLRDRVVSGDRNTGEPVDKQRRKPGEVPRDKPVEEEADKDVKHGGT